MRNRFTYICSILPAVFLLNNLPGFFHGYWSLIVAGALALLVWVLVWLRLYSTGSLRPEFAILTIVPQMAVYSLLNAGTEAINYFNTTVYQYIYTLLWIAAAFVGIRSMRAGTWEKPKGKKDSVYVMMSILTAIYCFFCCASFYALITNK